MIDTPPSFYNKQFAHSLSEASGKANIVSLNGMEKEKLNKKAPNSSIVPSNEIPNLQIRLLTRAKAQKRQQEALISQAICCLGPKVKEGSGIPSIGKGDLFLPDFIDSAHNSPCVKSPKRYILKKDQILSQKINKANQGNSKINLIPFSLEQDLQSLPSISPKKKLKTQKWTFSELVQEVDTNQSLNQEISLIEVVESETSQSPANKSPCIQRRKGALLPPMLNRGNGGCFTIWDSKQHHKRNQFQLFGAGLPKKRVNPKLHLRYKTQSPGNFSPLSGL